MRQCACERQFSSHGGCYRIPVVCCHPLQNGQSFFACVICIWVLVWLTTIIRQEFVEVHKHKRAGNLRSQARPQCATGKLTLRTNLVALFEVLPPCRDETCSNCVRHTPVRQTNQRAVLDRETTATQSINRRGKQRHLPSTWISRPSDNLLHAVPQ